MRRRDFLYENQTFELRGILFSVHNESGRFAREKQYSDRIEEKLIQHKIPYIREPRIGDSKDIPDFIVWDLIVVEVKAKPFMGKEEFNQVQRYLHQTNLKLGILVNFRPKYLNPQRILNVSNQQLSVNQRQSVYQN